VEVWFQRASDVVRKLRLGDIDLGIVGYDMFQEIGDGDRYATLQVTSSSCCSMGVGLLPTAAVRLSRDRGQRQVSRSSCSSCSSRVLSAWQ
jgi:ATP phosphoribosyltransferase